MKNELNISGEPFRQPQEREIFSPTLTLENALDCLRPELRNDKILVELISGFTNR